MPLAALSGTLGTSLASAAGSSDAAGLLAWTAIGATFCASLPAHVSSFNPAGGTPCVAAGVAVSAGGAFVTISGAPFGALLAASAGSLDAAGIAKWTAIGSAIVSWVGSYAQYPGTGLVGFVGVPPPATGPVTGVGNVSFANEAIGSTLAIAAGIETSDAVGVAKWTAIGAVLIGAIKSAGAIAAGSMQNPAVGGPLAGAGSFS